LYHGTTVPAAQAILKEGFNKFHIWWSSDPEKSKYYAGLAASDKKLDKIAIIKLDALKAGFNPNNLRRMKNGDNVIVSHWPIPLDAFIGYDTYPYNQPWKTGAGKTALIMDEDENEGLHYVGADEDDEGDYSDQAYELARKTVVNILSDKEPSLYALFDGMVVGALFVGTGQDHFSFDVVVDPEFQGSGIGSHLVADAENEYQTRREAFGDDYKMQVDVINPKMKSLLENRGYRVTQDLGGRWMMTKTAKGLLIGEVYLLHFDKPYKHARHYLGWAENAESRIEQHREGSAARLTQVIKDAGIGFVVAKVWAEKPRGFERQLKNQGGLSRHCPVCKAEGIDRDSVYRKREVQVAPETPTTGPDFVEQVTAAAKVQYLRWMETPEHGVVVGGFSGGKSELHSQMCERLSIPFGGPAYDKLSRGSAEFDYNDKKLVIKGYNGLWPSNDVISTFKRKYPQWEVKESALPVYAALEPLTPEDLKRVVQGERKDTIGECSATHGDCIPVSTAVLEALSQRYPDTEMVEGAYFRNREANEGWLHTWIEIPSQGLYIDPTHDQFGGQDPIQIGRIGDAYYQEHYEIDANYVRKTSAVAPPVSLLAALEALRPQLAAVAQKVYDENVAANAEDPDEEHGICDEIAQELQGVIVGHIADVDVTEGGQDGDDHAWVIAIRGQEVYGVDIAPSVYESGGGYAWKLHEGVKIQPSDVDIFKVDIDPEQLKTASEPLTKEFLERAAWEGRDMLIPDRDAQGGDCEPVSDKIYDVLKAKGVDAWIVYGAFGREPHSWVGVEGGWYIDATADQFQPTDGPYDPVRIWKSGDPDFSEYHANGMRTYASKMKTALQIEVPKSVRTHFWEEPPAGNLEFWAFRHPVNVLPGEKIVFTFNGAPVARTIVHHTEAPGQSKCENTGKYEKHHKVYWDPTTFVRLDGKN
jgi:ribosomal protein S18 acetylase RimI-like enzyme/predicted GIY-YIG superfamily endonuclease